MLCVSFIVIRVLVEVHTHPGHKLLLTAETVVYYSTSSDCFNIVHVIG